MPTNALPEAVSRHASELFPAGELRVLRPSEPGMSFGESLAEVWEHNTELVSGRATTPSDRLLATVMFEDVVGSTMLVSAAAPGETLVSRTVSDLVASSGLTFASHGIHQLKGVPGDWELLAATGGTTVASVPAQPPKPRLSDRLIVTAARRAPRVLTALNRLDSARSRRRS
jgi:hypothetical protein